MQARELKATLARCEAREQEGPTEWGQKAPDTGDITQVPSEKRHTESASFARNSSAEVWTADSYMVADKFKCPSRSLRSSVPYVSLCF